MCLCVCVCVFIKLHITAQCVCVCVCVCVCFACSRVRVASIGMLPQLVEGARKIMRKTRGANSFGSVTELVRNEKCRSRSDR